MRDGGRSVHGPSPSRCDLAAAACVYRSRQTASVLSTTSRTVAYLGPSFVIIMD